MGPAGLAEWFWNAPLAVQGLEDAVFNFLL